MNLKSILGINFDDKVKNYLEAEEKIIGLKATALEKAIEHSTFKNQCDSDISKTQSGTKSEIEKAGLVEAIDSKYQKYYGSFTQEISEMKSEVDDIQKGQGDIFKGEDLTKSLLVKVAQNEDLVKSILADSKKDKGEHLNQTTMMHCDSKSCDHYKDVIGTTNCILKNISISAKGGCNQFEPIPKTEAS